MCLTFLFAKTMIRPLLPFSENNNIYYYLFELSSVVTVSYISLSLSLSLSLSIRISLSLLVLHVFMELVKDKWIHFIHKTN